MAQFRGVVLDTSLIGQVSSIGKPPDLATYQIACSGIPSLYEYEETPQDCLGDYPSCALEALQTLLLYRRVT
jgi:hypothetical protein